ncbi:MAG: M28 family peptidase [Acidobacteriota bacterium]
MRGDYVATRMSSAGLRVHKEPFTFPQFSLQSSSLAVTVGGVPVPMAHDVLAYSGTGVRSADMVYVSSGRPENYLNVYAAGKIVLVKRDPGYHRSSQYREVIAHGGIGMLYVSAAPSNLIQVGTIKDPEDGLGPIPAITIGSDDGQVIIDGILAHQVAHATMSVAASVVPLTGYNVVGRIPGTDPSGAYFLLGAHYDTWQIGSADNGTGVSMLCELASELAAQPAPRFGLVFVGFDAEEQGLFGGYDYLRKHVVVGKEPMLAFVNFEIPGSDGTSIKALARTTASKVDEDVTQADLPDLYNPIVDMALVPQVFGGIIPTDIQGMYWYGLQGLSTACDTPYYHTVEDTPEKIDTRFLAQGALHFRGLLKLADAESGASYLVRDPTVWKIALATVRSAGQMRCDIVVTDSSGVPQPGATVKLWIDVDDFTRVHSQTATADAQGKCTLFVPGAVLALGQGSRWVHVTAGIKYPLAETMRKVADPVQ